MPNECFEIILINRLYTNVLLFILTSLIILNIINVNTILPIDKKESTKILYFNETIVKIKKKKIENNLILPPPQTVQISS